VVGETSYPAPVELMDVYVKGGRDGGREGRTVRKDDDGRGEQ